MAQQAPQTQTQTQRRPPRWLLLLFGVPVAFTLLSVWTTVQTRRSLRREGVYAQKPLVLQAEQEQDLYTLVQRHKGNANVSQADLLHLDDLARSDSYEQWAPVIVSTCMHGMDKLTAPCIKEAQHSNLIEAQELYYPAFRLKLPTFASSSMQDKWVAKGLHLDRMRVTEDKQWAEYAAFQGQNMVFKNALYHGDFKDSWSDTTCMGKAVSHLSFMHEESETVESSEFSVDTLVVATSPDSWSFQHFIDRVAVVWSQAQLVVPTTKKNDTVIVAGRTPRDPIVNDIYELMVGSHLHRPNSVFAKRLVFSCRAPLIHPFTTQRITENILQSLPEPATDAEKDRNIILILSRTEGGKAINGGRQIMNETAMVEAIAAMLTAEGRPEKVRYFRHSDFKGLNQVASFMRDRVKMMIGPHGAAFYNSRFAQPRTSVIEIIPDSDTFFVPCFWEQARLLGQDYSSHVARVVSDKLDMVVDDVPDLVALVRERLVYLDESYQASDALAYKYAWNVETAE